MKEVVKILKANAMVLVSLRDKRLKNQDIMYKSDSKILIRIHDGNMDFYYKSDYPKVVAIFMENCQPATSILNANQRKLISDNYKLNPYVELECDEDGYPILVDGKLVIYRFLSNYSNLTPDQALEKIKEFNERNSKNNIQT